jgi:hypothetical protein
MELQTKPEHNLGARSVGFCGERERDSLLRTEKRRAALQVRLYLNEMNVEGYNEQGSTNKRGAFLNLLADLRKMGITIEGVGLQGHFRSDMFPGVSKRWIASLRSQFSLLTEEHRSLPLSLSF